VQHGVIQFQMVLLDGYDHLRNHGCLRDTTGWRLAPAFDMNPNLYKQKHALTLNSNVAAPSMKVVRENGRRLLSPHTRPSGRYRETGDERSQGMERPSRPIRHAPFRNSANDQGLSFRSMNLYYASNEATSYMF